MSGVQRQARPLSPREPSQPQGHGRVAFLPFTRVVRKAGKDVRGEPVTVGDHVRHTRLRRGLLQRDVGALIGVAKDTVANWEKNKTEPPVASMPAIVRFLGYEPWPEPTTLPDKLRAYRMREGLSTKEAATRAGVDPDSWSTWERTGSIPSTHGRERVEAVLART
jgi:transcriptional regulator with XRE-family HTH domain